MDLIISVRASMAASNVAYTFDLHHSATKAKRLLRREADLTASKSYADKLVHMLAAGEAAIPNLGEAATQQVPHFVCGSLDDARLSMLALLH